MMKFIWLIIITVIINGCGLANKEGTVAAVKEKNTYYPIYISNENIEILRDKLLQEVEGKNYIVIFSQKVHKLYSKILYL